MVSAGSADRFVYIWDTTTRRILYKLPGPLGSVNDVDFHKVEPISKLSWFSLNPKYWFEWSRFGRVKELLKVPNLDPLWAVWHLISWQLVPSLVDPVTNAMIYLDKLVIKCPSASPLRIFCHFLTGWEGMIKKWWISILDVISLFRSHYLVVDYWYNLGWPWAWSYHKNKFLTILTLQFFLQNMTNFQDTIPRIFHWN